MIYVYETSGVKSTYEDTHLERIDIVVSNWNAQNKDKPQRSWVKSSVFPPKGYTLNSQTGKLETSEHLQQEVAQSSLQEQVNAGTITLDSVKSKNIQRIKMECIVYMESCTTASGYHMDMVCRDKYFRSAQYRSIAEDAEPRKSLLAQNKVYSNARMNEMDAKGDEVSAAGLAAISAIQAATTVAMIEAVKLSGFLP